MNSNKGDLPFKTTKLEKRTNPLETPAAPQQTTQNIAPQPVRQAPVAANNANRLKYTATMDINLHRRLKVAAALTGIQISAYIEEAVAAKLDKEGH